MPMNIRARRSVMLSISVPFLQLAFFILTPTLMFPSSASQEIPAASIGQVSPTSLDFGQVLVNQTSPQQRVRLTNTGDTTLTISNISIAGLGLTYHAIV